MVGLMWSGAEPSEGQFNTTYYEIMQTIILNLDARDIYVLLDVRQPILTYDRGITVTHTLHLGGRFTRMFCQRRSASTVCIQALSFFQPTPTTPDPCTHFLNPNQTTPYRNTLTLTYLI